MKSVAFTVQINFEKRPSVNMHNADNFEEKDISFILYIADDLG